MLADARHRRALLAALALLSLARPSDASRFARPPCSRQAVAADGLHFDARRDLTPPRSATKMHIRRRLVLAETSVVSPYFGIHELIYSDASSLVYAAHLLVYLYFMPPPRLLT